MILDVLFAILLGGLCGVMFYGMIELLLPRTK